MHSLKILTAVALLLLGVAIAIFFITRDRISDRRAPEVVAAEFEAQLAAAEARRWPRPPLFGEAETGTAWDYYRQAMDLFREAEEASPEAKDAFAALKQIDDIDSEISPAVCNLLDELEPAFRLLRRGACTRESGRHFSPRDGMAENPQVERAIPFAQAFKNAACVRAYRLAREEPARAVDSLLVLNRFGDDFKTGAPAIYFMVGVTVRNCALASLGELIGSGLLPREQTDRLLTWLRLESLRMPDLFEVGDNEMLFQQQVLWQSAEGMLPDSVDLASMKKGQREEIIAGFRRIRAIIGEFYPRAREIGAEKGVGEIGKALITATDGRALQLALTGDLVTAAMLKSISGMVSIVFEKLAEIPDHLLARQATDLLLIHTLRFHEKHGEYPDTIEEIITFAGADFPGAPLLFYLPRTPDSDKPAIYRLSKIEKEGLEETEPMGSIR